MNALEAEALFDRTLLGDYDAEDASEAIRALWGDGSREIFERAATWCVSDDPVKRARGAAILSQLYHVPMLGENRDWRNVEKLFQNESYLIVTTMLETEQDPRVLNSAVNALGHLGNAEAIPVILRFEDHPDADVRFQVACALGCFPDDPQSVRALLKLTSDSDDDVRDWAVLVVGVQGEVDSPEIRDALLRCLDDSNKEVREEAAVGLGKRHDQRLLPKLLEMVDEPGFTIRVAEAASALMGLDQDPPEWTAADYKPALKRKFNIPD